MNVSNSSKEMFHEFHFTWRQASVVHFWMCFNICWNILGEKSNQRWSFIYSSSFLAYRIGFSVCFPRHIFQKYTTFIKNLQLRSVLKMEISRTAYIFFGEYSRPISSLKESDLFSIISYSEKKEKSESLIFPLSVHLHPVYL